MDDQGKPAISGQAYADSRAALSLPIRSWWPADRIGVQISPFTVRSGPGEAGRWPLRDFLELEALPRAVPLARLHARRVLDEWGLQNLAQDSELVVTELVANAVAASRQTASSVRLWLLSDSARVVILVWDAVPAAPVRVSASEEAESGRGLMLVDAVSEQWGWRPAAGKKGKFVWAAVW